jgi:CRISPR-associated protein Cas2
MWMLVVTYDIADDVRRERLATLLSGYGPRVQLSVFECMVRSKAEVQELRAKIHAIIDREEDQVRLYPVAKEAANRTVIIGAREIEERKDFWIIR